MVLAANVGVTSQPRLTPYMNVDMFKHARRRGVQVDNLVPNGRPDQQDAALAEAIESASAWVDNTVLGTLAATYDTVFGQAVVDRYGYVRLRPRYRPVIALTDFWSGTYPNTLVQATDLSVAAVEPERISMPIAGGLFMSSSAGPLQFGAARAGDDPIWAKYTYINGFPVTSLTAAVTKGDLTVSVADCTGIIAGATWLTVYAMQNRFRFLAGAVSATSGPGTVACPAAPFSVPAGAGYSAPMVSALPADAIEAVVLATRAVIKESGGASSKAASTRHTGGSKDDEATAGDDFIEAEQFLHPYLVPVE